MGVWCETKAQKKELVKMRKSIIGRETGTSNQVDFAKLFFIVSMTLFSAKAEPFPDGGPYQEEVGGVTWNFCIVDGGASIGTGDAYSAIAGSKPKGIVEIPSRLG